MYCTYTIISVSQYGVHAAFFAAVKIHESLKIQQI